MHSFDNKLFLKIGNYTNSQLHLGIRELTFTFQLFSSNQIIMKTILVIFFTTLGTFAFGQSYNSAIGLRLGSPFSVTYKKFISESAAIEAYGGLRFYGLYSWVSASAAYQKHKPLEIESIENLNWYWGVGGSVYFWSYDVAFVGANSSSTSFSVDGYIGLEYTFTDTPVSISIDWVPKFFVNGFGNGFGAGYGGLAARYVLGGESK